MESQWEFNIQSLTEVKLDRFAHLKFLRIGFVDGWDTLPFFLGTVALLRTDCFTDFGLELFVYYRSLED